MSVIVKAGGGSTAKELVNATGTKLADLEKKGSGKVSVVGGLGNTPPEKVLQGSVYSDESGVRRTGTMEDITPDLNTQSDLIKEIRAMLVGRVTEANATPEDILKGKKAYVGEKLVTGVLEPLAGIDFGEVVLSEDIETISVSHRLGVIPKYVLLFPDLGQKYSSEYTWFILQGKNVILQSNVSQYGWYAGNGSVSDFQRLNQFATCTTSTIKFKSYSSSAKFKATKYYWIAIA